MKTVNIAFAVELKIEVDDNMTAEELNYSLLDNEKLCKQILKKMSLSKFDEVGYISGVKQINLFGTDDDIPMKVD